MTTYQGNQIYTALTSTSPHLGENGCSAGYREEQLALVGCGEKEPQFVLRWGGQRFSGSASVEKAWKLLSKEGAESPE